MNSETTDLVDELIAECIRAEDAGESVDRAALLAQHPEHAEKLRRFFADCDRMRALARPLADSRVSSPVKLRYVGDYELLERIACGGMGVVYKARQNSLKRMVAVKMILAGHLASEEDLKRFRAEAEAAAGLRHPNIVTVHEVGVHQGQHYFSMDFVTGRSLAEIVREHPLPPRKAARYVRDIAAAVHYAHQQGTLHRDLKPSNVLIDDEDQVRITDFGLALRTDEDRGLTRTGQLVGTPSYMAPEQARGLRSLIGPASDVYSLGVILYELATGRPPFRADTPVETLRQAMHEEPASPRLVNAKTPRDLETICLKCLEKEPHKRYPTAQHLVDDLGRYLNGEPIHARPLSRPARFARWCRRNPLVAALTTSAAGLLMTVATVALIAYAREAQLREQANRLRANMEKAYGDLKQEQERTTALKQDVDNLEARREALDASLEERQQKLFEMLMKLARALWQERDLVQADRFLEECPERLRDEQWRDLKLLCNPAISVQEAMTLDGSHAVAISPDGKWIAAPRGYSAQLNLWELATGEFVRAISCPWGPSALAFRPGSPMLAYAVRAKSHEPGMETNVFLCDVATGEVIHTLTGHTAPVTDLCFSDDGSLLASASNYQDNQHAANNRGEVIVWDLRTGAAQRTLPGFGFVALRGDGKLLAAPTTRLHEKTGEEQSVIQVWDLSEESPETDRVVWTSERHQDRQAPCAFSRQGDLLGFYGRDGQLEVWNIDERRCVARLPAGVGFSRFAFSPEGNRLACAGASLTHVRLDHRTTNSHTAVVWNLTTGEKERIFPWYSNAVSDFAFDPEGCRLATAEWERVRVWDVTPPFDPTEVILADVRELHVRPLDWPQWGGSRCRVNTPAGKNIPSSWNVGEFDRKTGEWINDKAENIKWVAPLGSQTYGNPVVANGKIFVGTNNGHGYLKRYPSDIDLGVLLCFQEDTGEFLWQHSNEKLPTGRVHDWPLQGVCSTPVIDGDRLWYVNNRGEVVCLDTEGFYDGEDDGLVQGVPIQVFDVTANLAESPLAPEAAARGENSLDERTIKLLLPAIKLNFPIQRYYLRRRSEAIAWTLARYNPAKRNSEPEYRVAVEDGKLRLRSIADDASQEVLAEAPVDFLAGLSEGTVGEGLRALFAATGFALPAELTVETIDRDQAWRITAGRAPGEQAFELKRIARKLVCTTQLAPPLKREADVVWSFNMMKELGVSQHNMSNCSPLIVGDALFVCTSNGVDESHLEIPAPEAPSFIALNRWTGEVLWTDNSPGLNILHSQWASPSYGVFQGQPQVIFPGGDGWVYSFDPQGDGQGNSKLLWKFDGNFKESKYRIGGVGTRNEIISFPAIYDGLVYIVMGQDPEHGEGAGCLWCIDPARRLDGSDVSAELAVDLQGNLIPHRRFQAVDPARGQRAIANPKSAVVWRYSVQDRNHDGKIDWEEEFHRSISIPAIKDNILYVVDFSGLFHCLDAKSGKVHWTYDMLAACWSSPLVVDGKVYIADEDGDVAIFRHSADPRKAMQPLRKTEPEDDWNILYFGEPWYGAINMDNSVYMTPVAANNVLYIANRTHLFAIAPE